MTQRSGFTLVEIMIVTALIAGLSALVVPCYMNSRREARRSSCLNNLQLIEHAKQQLATASQTLSDAYVADMQDLVPFFKGRGAPYCRSGGTYAVNAISNDPTCTLGSPPNRHLLVNEIQ